jgi:hypothetical protein
MAIWTPRQPRDRRLQLRATAREETLIKVGAERQGLNVTLSSTPHERKLNRHSPIRQDSF